MAIIFSIAEMAVPYFAFLFLAVAAIMTAVVMGLLLHGEVSWVIQFLIFAGASILGLILIRPKMVQRKLQAKGVPGRAEALVGKSGIATSPDRGTFEGMDWAIASEEELKEGDPVTVLRHDGITLVVKKLG